MNNRHISKGWLATIIIAAAVIIDQVIKIWVKTNFALYEDLRITDWFILRFVENNGMAFGWEWGPKLFLTWFRIIAVGLLIYYITRLCKSTSNVPKGFVACIALITAGALGNVIDCIFYGQIFNASTPVSVAQMFPAEGGYESLFNGRVVDMFYFPLFTWPDWVPLLGGSEFFQPVFNFADACLSVSVFVLVCFYSKHLVAEEENNDTEAADKADDDQEAAS
ncbi:MAG: lipoprotein signal peptidase [Bacteroidales bacterium]|nr:lipoprotein signal peptidase [Bacteroidales bacterium]